jgi:lipoyl synthase
MADRDLSDRAQRHPEKAHRPDTPVLRKPDWIRVKAPTSRATAGPAPSCARTAS